MKPLGTIFFTFAVATTLCVSAVGVDAANLPVEAPLRIAFMNPMSGAQAGIGAATLAQVKFDAERLNKKGGADGHPIEIVDFDNKANAQQTAIQLEDAINQKFDYVMLNGGEDVASVLLHQVDLHNKQNPSSPILFLNSTANRTVFTGARCSFWEFLFDANSRMKEKIAAKWVAEQPNITKVFLINSNDQYGYNYAKYVTQFLKADDPNVKIVGSVFVPLQKVKDYTPYITQISASGANAVMTGLWGPDMTLLTKSASDLHLRAPIMTFYSVLPGAPQALGQTGVGRTYLVWLWNGDYKDPAMAEREVSLKSKTGYDYFDLRFTYTLDMLRLAANKAHSVRPEKIALALEGLHFHGPTGEVWMRAEDHQLQVPLYVSVFSRNMKYGYGKTDHLNFHALEKFSAVQAELPSTCQMRNRPG
ncbi:MAG TPA: ABC transporter substrate-binding protein [Nevskiaceae bacterium]|nr:ABC transporter substrate-binding protein [Nevskiaceae bacterium]